MAKIDINRMAELLNNFNYEESIDDKVQSDVKSFNHEPMKSNGMTIIIPDEFIMDYDLQAEKEALIKKLEELNC